MKCLSDTIRCGACVSHFANTAIGDLATTFTFFSIID